MIEPSASFARHKRMATRRGSGSFVEMAPEMIKKLKELSGVYGLGFERESFLGVALPLGIVVVVGAVGWFVIRGVL